MTFLQELNIYPTEDLLSKAAHLSQVEFEHVADVVGVQVGELHQVLAVLKRLAQLLHPRLGAVHTVDPLQRTKTETVSTRETCMQFFTTRHGGSADTYHCSYFIRNTFESKILQRCSSRALFSAVTSQLCL